MTIRRNWQRPETVPIWAEIRVAGVLTNPSEPTLLTVSLPTGVALLTDVTMDNDSVGMFVYFWTSLLASIAGWYKTKVVAQDGTGAGAKVTVEYSGFYLQ